MNMKLTARILTTLLLGVIVLMYYFKYWQPWIRFQEHLIMKRHDELNTTVTECKKLVRNNTRNDLPTLYIVTPTYKRAEQLPELTRLAHTLMLVPKIHWLVIDDASEKSPLIIKLLEKSAISYDYLLAPMPNQYRERGGAIPKGVSNRNRGLEWIRTNATDGVLYFADDDNTYDLEIFSEMRYTKRVSMWPVGLITKFGVSSPVIRNGKFSGFYDGWIAGRKFPVDMAGFAIGIKFLLQRPKAKMPFRPGYEEDGFLKSLQPFEPSEIEFLASNCTKILVWHTQTKRNSQFKPLDAVKYGDTNIATLKSLL